ncbi:MAG: hypothetical protein ACO3LA_07975 [Ilumatobacteraceae bacterium]
MIDELKNVQQYLEIAKATSAVQARMQRLAESFAETGRSITDDTMLAVFIATATQILAAAQQLTTIVPQPPPEPEPEPGEGEVG